MQCLSIVSKRVHSLNGQAVSKVTRSQHIRRLATETVSPSPGSSTTPPPVVKKRGRRIFRRVLLYSSALTLGLYGAGTFAALRNEGFHDFFVEFVPYGERIIDYADQQGWEGHPVEPKAVVEAGKAAVQKLEHAANKSASATQDWLNKGKGKAQESLHRAKDEAEKLQTTGETLKTRLVKGSTKAQAVTTNTIHEIKDQTTGFSEEVAELVRKAEAALKSNGPLSSETELSHQDPPPSDIAGSSDKPTYTDRLPLGFEAPPGYVLPSKPKSDVPAHPPVEKAAAPNPLPLVAPAVSSLSSSEPVLAQLASTIDHLATFLKDNPSASTNAKDVLDTAQIDLVQLGERLQHVKDEEKKKLEINLEEQAREYTLKLLQLEMDAQDKLDVQERDWQKHFDMERQHVINAYRAKLEEELKAQSEIINERLKEEVIAQGIELQRRWIREIKVRVEEERGGRLAKLGELAADLKRLSKVTLENSAYLDENLRLHALWSSIRSLSAVIQDSPARKPFREELRILRHVAISGGAHDDPVLSAALETLEDSDIPDVGVEPFADLASWFTTSVAPRVSTVALVPDRNAGVLSYIASSILSSFRFQRRGLVEGDDALSVLARAEYYLNEKNLDRAARELNQLKGPAKLLMSDWLDAARKRLEVLQAIEVVQSQATLSSLLVV